VRRAVVGSEMEGGGVDDAVSSGWMDGWLYLLLVPMFGCGIGRKAFSWMAGGCWDSSCLCTDTEGREEHLYG
jgi:hypothetical protein